MSNKKTVPITIKRSLYEEMKNIKGEDSFNKLIFSFLTLFKTLTPENKIIFSLITSEGPQTAFLAGFLYRKICEVDKSFLPATINLSENLSVINLIQLCYIMIRHVEKSVELEPYLYISCEIDKDIQTTNYDNLIKTGITQDLFELGVSFHI